MRILYVHQLFSTRGGAVGTRSYEIAQRMVARGHDVTILCGSYANASTGIETPFVKGRREGMVNGIRVIEIDVPIGNKMSFLARTGAFARFVASSIRPVLGEQYDLIYATSTPLTVAIHGIIAKILRRKKFIFEVRDLWPELPKAMGVITNPVIIGGMSLLEWAAYRSADACVGLSPGIVEGIRRRAGQAKPILFAPNAADLDFFAETDKTVAQIPGVDDSHVVAIFSGTHGIANGLENILDAAAVMLKHPHPLAQRIRFVFIGDGGRKAQLQARAAAQGLNNCIFLDPAPKTILRSFLARADIGVMSLANVKAFYYGTSPNKFFDYLAASLPVICNYPGWVAELVVAHECGQASLPEDPQSFVDAMLSMAGDPDRLRRMGANARALGESQFNRDRVVNDVIAFVEKVCQQSDHTARKMAG